MKIKIFQIDKDKDINRVIFDNYKNTLKYSGKIDPSIYKTVFDGNVECNNLYEIYDIFNNHHPVTFQGHSLSVSDIIEVVGDAPELVGRIRFYYSSTSFEEISYIDSKKYNFDIAKANEVGRTIKAVRLADKHIPAVENGLYFCDSIGFTKLTEKFDTNMVNPMQGIKMLVVKPHKLPYEALIEDDYKAFQRAVGGNFEIIGNGDGTFLICNEEGKIKGLEGNREVNDDIIVGTFLISADAGDGNVKDLTDEQIAFYMQRFAEDETYTQDEIEEVDSIKFMSM